MVAFLKKYLFNPKFPFDPKRCLFFYGWLIVIFITLVEASSSVARTSSLSPFIESLTNRLSLTTTSISLAYTLGNLLSILTLPLLGYFYDKFPVRLFVPLIVSLFALTLIGLGSLEVGYAHMGPNNTFCLLLILFSGLRVGIYAFSLAGRSLIASWFEKKRAFATSFSCFLISISSSGAPWLAYKLSHYVEWKSIWRGAGMSIGLIFIPLSWLILRKKPKECGLTPDGKTDLEVLPTSSTKPTAMPFLSKDNASSFLASYKFWVFNLLLALHALQATGISFHLVPISKEFQMNPEIILKLLFPVSFLTLFTNFLAGRLFGKIGIKNLFIFFAFNNLVMLMALLHLNSHAMRVVFILSAAMDWGLNHILLYVTWPSCFGLKCIGNINGWALSTACIGSALGPFLFGFSKEIFSYSFGIKSIMVLIGLFIYLLFRMKNVSCHSWSSSKN